MSGQLSEINQGLICPYCGDRSELIDSKEIYGRSYGNIYICRPCDAYVGCHKYSTNAKGSLANKELRDARQAAHAAFDPIWELKMARSGCDRQSARENAYQWLSRQLNIAREETHIAMFDLLHCQAVVKLCNEWIKTMAKKTKAKKRA